MELILIKQYVSDSFAPRQVIFIFNISLSKEEDANYYFSRNVIMIRFIFVQFL